MLGEFGDDAKILAGGQSLVPMLAMRLTHFENLIDISRVDELKASTCRDDERVGRRQHHRTRWSGWTTRSPTRFRC